MIASQSLKKENFIFLQNLIYKKTGIIIGDSKKEMICRRLSKRMKDLSIHSLDNYCDILRLDCSPEMNNFISSITTNITYFFRENHHFEYLRDSFLPEFINKGQRRLRLWSSACSTGEEPYSMAMILKEALGEKLNSIDTKLLATDLDDKVVRAAKKGVYDSCRLKDISTTIKSKWFKNSNDSDEYIIDPSLRKIITFNTLNLLEPWPMKGKFDVIFCRNVFIYFDKSTQEMLVKRFFDILSTGGVLMLGHSESILKGSDKFNHIGKTIYLKKVS